MCRIDPPFCILSTKAVKCLIGARIGSFARRALRRKGPANRLGPVSSDLHRDRARHTGTFEVAHGGAAQVMKQPPGTARFLAGKLACARDAAELSATASDRKSGEFLPVTHLPNPSFHGGEPTAMMEPWQPRRAHKESTIMV